MNEALARLVRAAGIDSEYWDALGQHHVLDATSAVPLLRALGLDPDGDVDAQCALLAAEAAAHATPPDLAHAGPAPRCFIPRTLADGRRIWGLSVQLYSLRSARNWGVGDFTDLAAFAAIAARHGARIVGINPLHARHLACP